MAFVHATILAAFITHVASYCPVQEIVQVGECSLRLKCYGALQNVSLPSKCQGSVNDKEKEVDLTITQTHDRFDENIDTEFLNSITSLTATGNWPVTNLTFLNHMTQIKRLTISHNHIQTIEILSPFFYLDNLEHLDLSFNKLTDITELLMFENIPCKVTFVSLAHNDITDISMEAFDDLTSLVELDLSNNSISDLSGSPFNNLTMLQVLKLENNRIISLDDSLDNLDKLKHLFVSGNMIQNLDERLVSRIQQLKTFDISGNQLLRVKPTVFLRHWESIDGICKIRLSGNQIGSLPNGTKEIRQRYSRDSSINRVRTELDLSRNNINVVGYNAFQHILQLVSLDLSHNRLEYFTINIDDLLHIQYLDLSHNRFTFLSNLTYSYMPSLKKLDLSFNYLRIIPENVFTNTYSLVQLNMSNNQIHRGHDFRILTDSHSTNNVLDLSNNSLTSLSLARRDYTSSHISVLILRSNNIVDPSNIDVMSLLGLNSLEMNKNKIEKLDISSLRGLPLKLISLDLSSNLIDEIGPATFYGMFHLKSLNLGHNKLKYLQYGVFQGLNSVSSLDLSYNNIAFLDSKPLMDLKSLDTLSLKNNGLQSLDYKGWLGHTFVLDVFLEGNNYSCEWLGKALSDFNNGYSKMKPMVKRTVPGTSIEGIPCRPKSTELEDLTMPDSTKSVLVDERLLNVNQKILQLLKEQTYYLRGIFNQNRLILGDVDNSFHELRHVRKARKNLI